MDFDRLGKRRANRTRTWASVCVGLFCAGDSATEETASPEDPEESG
jgi:hypothetical protein